jgi:lysozyme
VTFSQDCYDLAASHEGCILRAYDDARPHYILQLGDKVKGTLTIGRGHTGPDVYIGLVWTQEQADAQFACDLEIAAECVHALVKVPLTQGQFDALTDFTFQEGSGTLQRSTLLKRLKDGSYAAVPNQLCRQDPDGSYHGYVFAFGEVNADLIKRRQAEIALWNKKEEA